MLATEKKWKSLEGLTLERITLVNAYHIIPKYKVMFSQTFFFYKGETPSVV